MMVVLGLVLIVAAAAFGVELFVSNNETETLGEVFGEQITQLSAGGYFLLGSATTVALFFGVLLLDSGLRAGRRRKEEREELEAKQAEAARQAQWEKAAAVSEAERLRDELVEERMNQATLGGVVMPPDVEAPGTAEQSTAAPVDDPEHAEDDHRGLLGRIRGDREELPEPASVPAQAGAPSKAATAEAARPSAHWTGRDAPAPRPEVATDAFNAAIAPPTDRERPAR